MKLVRYGPPGKEKPGLIDADGMLRDLSRKVDGHRRRRARARVAVRRCASSTRAGCPPSRAARASGPASRRRRSSSRSASTSSTTRRRPARRFPNIRSCSSSRRPASSAPNDNVMLPLDSTQLDWEVELGVVIGRTARYVAAKDALRYVAGYCVINDVSEREFQMKRSATQWSKGKGCDTFGPIGPWLVTSRRDQGPAEPRHVARRQRRAAADRQHAHDDLRRRASWSPTSRAT